MRILYDICGEKWDVYIIGVIRNLEFIWYLCLNRVNFVWIDKI